MIYGRPEWRGVSVEPQILENGISGGRNAIQGGGGGAPPVLEGTIGSPDSRRSESGNGNLIVQLEDFLRETRYGARGWLNSQAMDVYVRRNRRPYGPPGSILGFSGGKIILPSTECLEIAEIELKKGTIIVMDNDKINKIKKGTDLTPWDTFISQAINTVRGHHLKLIYIDDVRDSQLKAWFEEHKDWQKPADYNPVTSQERPYSFFLWV